ncbi:hypothetical protein C0993_000864, partial [Termitomyces sp. T159_Od127]
PVNSKPIPFKRVNIDIAEFVTNKAHWIGRIDREPQSNGTYTLQQLRQKGFQILSWDGRTPQVLLDEHDRIFAVLAGVPDEPLSPTNPSSTNLEPPRPNCWTQIIGRAERQMEVVHRAGLLSGIFKKAQKAHRRGNFFSLPCGVSFGGGQKVRLFRLCT